MKGKAKKRAKGRRVARDSFGSVALTEREVRAIVENMIPKKFRPYYCGYDAMRVDLTEPWSVWNSDIMLYFKSPVIGCVDDARYAHASLERMRSELSFLQLDETSVGNDEYAEYDNEHENDGIIAIPIRKGVKRG